MANEKPPKHKPQKKHTLSEVLKSLQDLIRTDLVNAQGVANTPQTVTQTPAANAPPPPPPPPPPPSSPSGVSPSNESDSFHDALKTLDDMIQHKIIEPVERARQTPPEPLLPDETIEIEWDDVPEDMPAEASPQETDVIKLEPIEEPGAETPAPADEAISLESPAPPISEPQEPAPPSNNVIELETFEAKPVGGSEPDTTPPLPQHLDNVVPLEVVVVETTEPVDTSSSAADEPTAREEQIEIADVAPSVEASQEITVPDPQSTFDFTAPASSHTRNESAPVTFSTDPTPAENVPRSLPEIEWEPTAFPAVTESSPAPESVLPDLTSIVPTPARQTEDSSGVPTLSVEFDIADINTAELDSLPEPPRSSSSDISPTVTLTETPEPASTMASDTGTSAEKPAETSAPTTSTKREVPSSKATTIDFDTVREPPYASPDISPTITLETPQAPENPPASPNDTAASTALEVASPEITTEKQIDPEATSPKTKPSNKEALSAPRQEEIPILKEVVEQAAPLVPPLPDVAQARDIAIRVIARLNIERRKAGEKPLDIKTIEKLQQYLADALNKRALSKPK